ncbi:uncharacterized protein (TIGR03083 family) [Mumia flava]|uniref:Uncharacterized protein (TIGR03083 family) n=1 Tax=Mumia flava TaxID=1348852 RepID=A0A0B2B0S0_9ACTN|nr:maleylpyruvate isomerase family mycothiol-dependent enzyme [Mumia flava]PJJ48167.1 uncharacterized protein (TIGR03083 family) [Mumia flava]
MDTDTLWKHTDQRRHEIVTLLRDLRPEEWDRPSLCEGWTVRDVAAHLSLAETAAGRAAIEIVRARGSLNRMIHDTAVRRAATWSDSAVIDAVEATIGTHRHAIGVTDQEPLLDALVHGADIAVPLGRALPMAPDAAAVAATRVWSFGRRMSSAFRAQPRSFADGRRLVATDVDWSAGQGPDLRAPIEQILLLLTGRPVGLPA